MELLEHKIIVGNNIRYFAETGMMLLDELTELQKTDKYTETLIISTRLINCVSVLFKLILEEK